jgi:predicted pyridoxine 5'-phosphate oxidase superfamily flavin-nucleotide-binding protein
MGHSFAGIAFTPSVRAAQERYGSRERYSRMDNAGEVRAALGEHETAFLAERDSFYLATVGDSGWPYVQHRGGPRGFVRVLDEHTLAFADFRGNLQYVSVGNVDADDRVSLIFVDYANRERLKLFGRLRWHEAASAAPALRAAVDLAGYRARVERIAVIDVAALDWNCPQHITPRYTLDEIEPLVAPLQARIAELEAALAAGRAAPDSPDAVAR